MDKLNFDREDDSTVPDPYFWMKLPVDMDGVPIREGDKVQFVNDAGGTGAAVEVCAVSKHYETWTGGTYACDGSSQPSLTASAPGVKGRWNDEA